MADPEVPISPEDESRKGSESIEVNRKEISSRNTINSPKFAGYPDDSDDDIPIPAKKSRVESTEKIDYTSLLHKVHSKMLITETNVPNVECPECEYRSTTVSAWIFHLRSKHNTTPMLAGFALRCACGKESFSADHSIKCNLSKTTVIRKRDGPIRRSDDEKTTPQCVLCEVFPKTAYGYILHLAKHHKSTLFKNGIYLICSCGLVFRYNPSSRSSKVQAHSKKCNGRKFSLHKLSDGIPNNARVPVDCNNSGEEMNCGRKNDTHWCDQQEPDECNNNADDEMHARREQNALWWDKKITCDLCGKRTNVSIVSPDHPVDSRIFFDNLIELTPEQRTMVECCVENNLIANVCLRHFEKEKTSGIEIKRYNNTICKEDAVCYICGERTTDFCVPPIVGNSFSSTRLRFFFDNLINLTPVQRQRANYYRDKGLGTTVCKKHVCGRLKSHLHKISDEARIFPSAIQQSTNDLGGVGYAVSGDIPPLFLSMSPEERMETQFKEEIKEELEEEDAY